MNADFIPSIEPEQSEEDLFAQNVMASSNVSSRSTTSIYDRLYKASTASSKCRKEVAPVVTKNILMRENEDPVVNKPSKKSRIPTKRPIKKKPMQTSGDGAVFNRLYAKSTASSASKLSSRAPMKPKNQY